MCFLVCVAGFRVSGLVSDDRALVSKRLSRIDASSLNDQDIKRIYIYIEHICDAVLVAAKTTTG